MKDKDIKNAVKLFRDLMFYRTRVGKEELSYDDKPYINFLNEIYPFVCDHPTYSDEILSLVVDRYITRTDPKNTIDIEFVEEMISSIKRNFEINQADHYLIFPLQGSELSEDFSFENFTFIKEKAENDLIKQFCDITTINEKRVEDFIQHTKNSRSPDFLKHNMVVVKIANQTDNVGYSAVSITKGIVYLIKLLYKAAGLEENIFITHTAEYYEDNHHVAIISADSWRCGHRCWSNRLLCKIEIDFIKETTYQQIFSKLFYCFIINHEMDALTYKFYNALILFNRSLEQKEHPNDDDSLALLLLFSAAESLLTEGENEKKLRLCVLLPRLCNIDGYTTNELASKVRDLYEHRNQFVHAGVLKRFYDIDNKDIFLLQQMVAKLILLYLELEERLDLTKDKNTLNAWKKYINNMFDDAIF